MLTSPEMLVPVDFSPCSVNALRIAIGMAAPEGDVTLLHVIDQQFIDDAVAAGLGSSEDIRNRLKEQAEANFSSMLEGIDTGNVDIEKMTVRFAVRRDSQDRARSGSADDRDGRAWTFDAARRNPVWLNC